MTHGPAHTFATRAAGVRAVRGAGDVRMVPPCSADPELWFSTDPDLIEDAKAACWSCGHRALCREIAQELESGVSLDYRFGVWGASTPQERWEADPTTAGLNRTCARCGTAFIDKVAAKGGRPRKYCSRRCQQIAWNTARQACRAAGPPPPTECEHCGTPLEKPGHPRRFCNNKCRDRARRARLRTPRREEGAA